MQCGTIESLKMCCSCTPISPFIENVSGHETSKFDIFQTISLHAMEALSFFKSEFPCNYFYRLVHWLAFYHGLVSPPASLSHCHHSPLTGHPFLLCSNRKESNLYHAPCVVCHQVIKPLSSFKGTLVMSTPTMRHFLNGSPYHMGCL